MNFAHRLLKNRGPNDFSYIIKSNISIYHSRLAIVGTNSDYSKQPIKLNNRMLFCNGFISNYDDIYNALSLPQKDSDCEALLHLYERKQVSGLSSVRGQFAAVIVDNQKDRLILIRDCTGICPLYYYEFANSLFFGSQATWLCMAINDLYSGWKIIIDNSAYKDWQSCGYSLGPRTLIKGIREVEAGTALEFSLSKGVLEKVHSFKRFNDLTIPSVTESTKKLTFQAVQRNLKGDHCPWLLLSGGLDSLIVLHCVRYFGYMPKIVCLAYPKHENENELKAALEISKYYGCKISIIKFPDEWLSPNPALFRERVDWPLDGGSLLGKMALANHIRKHGGHIVLGGTGADELFGGYRRHLARASLLTKRICLSEDEEFSYYRKWIAPNGSSNSVFQMFVREKQLNRFEDPAFFYDLLELSQLHNPRIDSCFANIGIEYRPIFQDFDLVNFASKMQLSQKTSPDKPKILLRKAFKKSIPDKFLQVPKRPLRFGNQGPNAKWRNQVFKTWQNSRPVLF